MNFTAAEIRMLRAAMRIALEDGSLVHQDDNGDPDKKDAAMADRICAKLDVASRPTPKGET